MQKQCSWLLVAVLGGLLAANQGIAQSPGTAPKAGTRLITLGTAGGPVPRAKRAQSSNLLIVNGTPYLIDAGDGTARRLAKLKFNLRSLGTIFITHGHNDHTGGLPHLLSVQWGAQRSQPINVYGPPGTQGMIKAAIGYLNYDAEIRISDGSRTTPIEQVFFGHDIGSGQVYQDANITVTAVENTHFHFPAGSPGYGKYKSYSYRFKTPDRVILFTGDTGASDALTGLAKDADILVSEVVSVDDVKESRIRDGRWQAMSPKEQQEYIRHMIEEHITPEQIGKMATKANVKTVILSHLTPRPDSDDYTAWADEVRKHFSGQVLIAEDLKEF
jgi:ribonuclease BN (tRNA processing enzyme)